MGFNKEFHRKGLKRKYSRVEGNAKGDNTPIGGAKSEKVGEDQFVSLCGRPYPVMALSMQFLKPIPDGCGGTDQTETDAYEQRPLPLSVERPGPGIRHLARRGASPWP